MIPSKYKYYIYRASGASQGFSKHRHRAGGLLRAGCGYVRYDARWSSVMLALLPREKN